MKILYFVVSLAFLCVVLGHPQVGVKTHQVPINPFANLVLNSTNSTNGPPLATTTNTTSLYPQLPQLPHQLPQFPPQQLPQAPLQPPQTNVSDNWRNTLNRTQMFLNKTRSEMSRGICYQEVPTATLVANPRGNIPTGNGSNPSLSRVQVCCTGYEKNPHNWRLCDPICHTPCLNGLCVAPDTCACYPDYAVDLDGKCIPVCPIGCSNGQCQPDRSCKCNKGFILDPSGKFCIEGVQCDSPCLNGYCTGYNKCTCHAGYLPHPTNPYMCMPHCPAGCPNGVCSGPSFCICNSGYVKDRSVKGSQACVRRMPLI